MDWNHEFFVALSKSWGLFYLIGLTIAVLVYALWPRNRKKFDRAKKSIFDKTDRPGK